MDAERAEVAVVGPQRLNELVGVGQGVNVGPAEPVDPAGDYRVGGLGRDTVRLLARTKPDCDVPGRSKPRCAPEPGDKSRRAT